jgi:hypothetical protein
LQIAFGINVFDMPGEGSEVFYDESEEAVGPGMQGNQLLPE